MAHLEAGGEFGFQLYYGWLGMASPGLALDWFSHLDFSKSNKECNDTILIPVECGLWLGRKEGELSPHHATSAKRIFLSYQ